MRKNSLLSPVTDLFIALSLVFFVLFLSKAEPLPPAKTEEMATAMAASSRAVKYQRLRHGKDGAFKFGGSKLTLETAFHARQAVFNRIHKVREDWRGKSSVQQSELHFRIVTNSDPLLGDNSYGNWNRSAERALAVLRAGFCSQREFMDVTGRTVAAALADRIPDSRPAPGAAPCREWADAFAAAPARGHWLYGYECAKKSMAPRLVAYICLWNENGVPGRVALLRRSKFEKTEMLLVPVRNLPARLRRFMEYREDLPFGPVAYNKLYMALDEAWESGTTLHAPRRLDSNGLFFETMLDEPPGEHHTAAGLDVWDERLFPFLPFFLIATKGSFDSFAPHDQDVRKLVGTLYGTMLGQLQRDAALPPWRIPHRIKRLVGLDKSLDELPPARSRDTPLTYFRRHEDAIKFLITCQLSRGYDIFDIGEEYIYGAKTFHIQSVLEQLEYLSLQDTAVLPSRQETATTSPATLARMGIYKRIKKAFEGTPRVLDAHAPYAELMPTKKSAEPPTVWGGASGR